MALSTRTSCLGYESCAVLAKSDPNTLQWLGACDTYAWKTIYTLIGFRMHRHKTHRRIVFLVRNEGLLFIAWRASADAALYAVAHDGGSIHDPILGFLKRLPLPERTQILDACCEAAVIKCVVDRHSTPLPLLDVHEERGLTQAIYLPHRPSQSGQTPSDLPLDRQSSQLPPNPHLQDPGTLWRCTATDEWLYKHPIPCNGTVAS